MNATKYAMCRGTSLRIALILGLVLGFACAASNAQEFPTKPVRVVATGATGSLNDLLARLVFSRVAETLGQPFIVENLPGAGGIIAAEVVAKAPPDGYTLLITANSTMVISPFLHSKLSYDSVRDFEPVSMLAKVSELLIVNSSLGVKTLDEFVRLVKSRPGQITYASGGNGATNHLMMELFQREADIHLIHVPYKSMSPAIQAIVSGEVAVLNIGTGLARPHISSGKVVALATTGQPARNASPGIPALTSSFPRVDYIPWVAVFARKGASKDVVAKLNAEIEKALTSPGMETRMETLDLSPIGGSAGDLGRTLRADLELNRELVKSIGLKLD